MEGWLGCHNGRSRRSGHDNGMQWIEPALIDTEVNRNTTPIFDCGELYLAVRTRCDFTGIIVKFTLLLSSLPQ